MRESQNNSSKSTLTDEEGQGELYSPAYAVKLDETAHKKQPPATDEEGQGELYSPGYAVNVETGRTKQLPPMASCSESKSKARNEADKEGNGDREKGRMKEEKRVEEGRGKQRKSHHDQQQKLYKEDERIKPSSKL